MNNFKKKLNYSVNDSGHYKDTGSLTFFLLILNHLSRVLEDNNFALYFDSNRIQSRSLTLNLKYVKI